MGLYYLNSRYYDSNTGRFINADGQLNGALLGNNQYAYCENSPIIRVDFLGNMWQFTAIDPKSCSKYGSDDSDFYGGYASEQYSTYKTYQIRCKNAALDAKLFGYYFGSVSHSVSNPGYYIVPGAESVTDSMATSSFSGTVLMQNSYNLNGQKGMNYVEKRGWNNTMINSAISAGAKGSSINMYNGALCSVYCYPGMRTQYVVIERVSRNLVQLSDFKDSSWIPDSRIIWD